MSAPHAAFGREEKGELKMYLTNIYPFPKSFSEDASSRFIFGSRVTARVSGINAENAERIKTLWFRFSCDASELELTDGGDGFRFEIGNAPSCDLKNGDSYAVSVSAYGVAVAGSDTSSLLNGISTLVQLICPENLDYGKESFYILSAEIHDAPQIGFRALHICLFPGTKLCSVEQAINLAGFLKFTHVILEYWGTFPYECMPDLCWADRSFTKDEIRSLSKLVRSYGMEVIPMINHFGHATQSRGCHGRHVTLNKNPRRSLLFEPDGWTWCLSNPDTYRLLAEMRAELTETVGCGSYFHLGFDEADSFATCPRCRQRVPAELLAEYLNRLTDDLCSRNIRPIVWHDMFISGKDFHGDCYLAANGHTHNTDKALDLLDRRIIIADWEYGYTKGFNPTTPYFISKGFDTVICPWTDRGNIKSITEDVVKYGASGLIMTTWHQLPRFLSDAAFWANCAWTAGEKPEGTRFAEAACLLRRLSDAEGSFEKSGWSVCEVEK